MNKYTFALSFAKKIGPVKFSVLLRKFGSAEKAYNAPVDELKAVLGNKLALQFESFRKSFNPEKKMEEIRKKGIEVICLGDKNYPRLLKNISDPPICLYLKGNSSLLNLYDSSIYFAVVGTRKPSNYGRLVTRRIVSELAVRDVVIVSGLAMGIDAIAHKTTLENDGRTVAVLGCGVDVIYPRENARLYEEILKKKGAIISEFPPGQLVLKGLFVSRNRIISGLSRGTLVVEGTKRSGSLITASYAAKQGREVFGVPGPITSSLSEAPNLLIKQGATLVTEAEDIFATFSLPFLKRESLEKGKNLEGGEKEVFDLLKKSPLLVDEISDKLGIPIEELSVILTNLEIKGLVINDISGKIIANL